jgi:hypothetical protein
MALGRGTGTAPGEHSGIGPFMGMVEKREY